MQRHHETHRDIAESRSSVRRRGRTGQGYAITNLAKFEGMQVNCKTLITRTGSNERIIGSAVNLNSDTS